MYICITVLERQSEIQSNIIDTQEFDNIKDALNFAENVAEKGYSIHIESDSNEVYEVL